MRILLRTRAWVDPLIISCLAPAVASAGVFAYAKQVAAFAAAVMQPNELWPSVGLADSPPCCGSHDTRHGVAQKRQFSHPIHQGALRQPFLKPPSYPQQMLWPSRRYHPEHSRGVCFYHRSKLSRLHDSSEQQGPAVVTAVPLKGDRFP